MEVSEFRWMCTEMFLKYHKGAMPGKKHKVNDNEKSLDSKQQVWRNIWEVISVKMVAGAIVA